MTSIIIVNHNTSGILKDCIESILKFENQSEFEVIIIDNASSDDSIKVISELQSKHQNVKTVILNEQKNFSYANNRGIVVSNGEFVLIMNPDIFFTEPLLNKLTQKFSEHENLGAISPSLLGTNGKFQRNYFQRYPTVLQFIFFQSLFAKLFFRFPKLMNRYLENHDIDVSTKKYFAVEQTPCAFFLTTRRILDQIGLLDEDYPLFFEDVDLSYRIHNNYKLLVDTSLAVTHLGGESFKSKDKWRMYGNFILSMNIFFDKHRNIIRRILLKYFSITNSIWIITIEYLKKIFGALDNHRMKKHKHFLKLFWEYYF